jgi:predicted O-methyltransferase YrrM
MYCDLAENIRPWSILELGVFEGGSYVFLDKVFRPAKLSALDLREEPTPALLQYVQSRDCRTLHFGASQTDERILDRIITEDLSGRLDMVVDDASHAYDLTRRSFELLYPRLAPGGTYIIEDWAWAHFRRSQGDGALGATRPALTNLIFDLVQLQGSTDLIAELRICRSMAIVRKPDSSSVCPIDIFSLIQNRGKCLNQI